MAGSGCVPAQPTAASVLGAHLSQFDAKKIGRKGSANGGESNVTTAQASCLGRRVCVFRPTQYPLAGQKQHASLADHQHLIGEMATLLHEECGLPCILYISSQPPASRRSIGAWWPDEGSAPEMAYSDGNRSYSFEGACMIGPMPTGPCRGCATAVSCRSASCTSRSACPCPVRCAHCTSLAQT